MPLFARTTTVIALLCLCVARSNAADIEMSSGNDPSVNVEYSESTIRCNWPINKTDTGYLVLDVDGKKPLIQELGVNKSPVLKNVDPVLYLTVGSRDLTKQGWNVFFDNPPRRPHETFTAKLTAGRTRIHRLDGRTTITIDGLSAGKFAGQLVITIFGHSGLIQTTAVLSTEEESRAILYDVGLKSSEPTWKNYVWLDTQDELQRTSVGSKRVATPLAVRHRAMFVESDGGSLALFPPPHQFMYPLDFSDNFKLAWQGPSYRDLGEVHSFGVRQPPDGDGRFVPWINAPPESQQRLSVFYLVSAGTAEKAFDEVKKLTNGDRFPDLPGYKKFTSHYHVEHSLDYLAQQRKQGTTGIPKGLEDPGFVQTFKARGVDIVHLAEFHVNHSPDFIAQRLPQLELMHNECRRLSDDKFLLLPGEEPNVHLGGHWISLFPKPVYWLLHPKESDPFVREIDGLGKVYAVHNAEEVQKLMKAEGGLMWTAHPRTKSSFDFPDRYKNEPFYQSDRFLGAAWKNLPADLSKPRLGTRALDLLSDMANWGPPKYMLGEVDVFKVQPDHELYGHMNVNYLKLDKLPKFDDGWQPVLDALRGGKFFVTTGEVLITKFEINGKGSGETITRQSGDRYYISYEMKYKFPLAFNEIIWSDGELVHSHRLPYSHGGERVSIQGAGTQLHMPNVKWVRLEVWDVATNGAFTQPIWVK